MKKIKNKILCTLKIFVIVITSCICMASSCGGGPSGGGGNSNPVFECSIAELITMWVPTVKLAYNFNTAPAAFDIIYFRTYHPNFSAVQGEINYLDYIVNDITQNAIHGGSSIKIKVTSASCLGNGNFTATNSTAEQKVISNYLYHFPMLDIPLTAIPTMDCTIQSVKDFGSRYILWSCKPDVTAGGYINRIQASGIYKYPGSGTGAYIIIPRDHFGESFSDSQYAIIVENASIDYDYDNINLDEATLITDDNVMNTTLSRSVYIRGEYNDAIRWNEPLYLMLY